MTHWIDQRGVYAVGGKRLLDAVVGAMALPLVGLVTLGVGVAIKLDDGGPLFFEQERRGRYGKPFKMLKFRSMKVDAPDLRNPDSSTVASASDWRVTRVGRVLRKTSIDELPQLVNVFKGDMSLIGPRPNLTTTPLERLEGDELLRLSIRPGITGYNQAYFRNSSTLEQRYANDCGYAKRITLLGDLRILAATVTSVVAGKNLYSTGEKR